MTKIVSCNLMILKTMSKCQYNTKVFSTVLKFWWWQIGYRVFNGTDVHERKSFVCSQFKIKLCIAFVSKINTIKTSERGENRVAHMSHKIKL